MNKTSKITPFALLVLCLALGNGRTNADPEDYPSTSRTDSQTKKHAITETGEMAKCHKASGIIGMNVRNEKDERLGEIKDLVFDLQSERVAYVVMGTSTVLPGKLLAVPLSAFTPSGDRKHLILRADKAKVEAAAGFDRNHWPDPSNPTWAAEPFWEKQSPPSDTPGTYDKDKARDLNVNPADNPQPKPDNK
jgi:sporulation protein YlmC with PRC-barrel domain